MIEFQLRWKLEPPMPNKGREDRWTLQSRLKLSEVDYTEWVDVPYVDPQKETTNENNEL